MATTTNFGWETPDDTDLVKDGALAMRTLGNSIDTSFVDLKGGTTGQVLSKATNTDLDYTWITPNVGDITEVQAGTGISVASGTGPIPVVTNTVATTFDAKGDLVVGTGADTFARLAVGATNGHSLQIDSSTSTGLKWAAAAGTSGPAFSVYRNTNQTVSNNVWTKVQFASENFDTDNCFDSTTNYRFTPTTAGKYQISFQAFNGGASVYAGIYKNGSELHRTQQNVSALGSVLIDMNGSSDYLEFYAMVTSDGKFEGSGNLYTYASGAWIRS